MNPADAAGSATCDLDRTLEDTKTNRAFPALAHTAFLLVWSGALVSNIGNWIENVCQGWLVYDTSHSTVWSGLLQFAASLPSVVLAIPMGVVADRFDRRRLLLATQIALAAFASLQAFAAHMGWTSPQTTVAIAFLESIAAGAMVPCWQAYLPELVPREELGNAITLNSIQFNAARLLGPMLAAPIIAAWGIPIAFDLNVASFFLVIAALAFLRSRPAPEGIARGPWLSELREGFRYARSERAIVRLIGCGSLYLFLACPVLSQLPAISVELMGGKVGTYSSLLSAVGLGAVVGGLFMGRLHAALRLQRSISFFAVMTGAALVALSFSRSEILSLSILFAFGFGWCVTLTSQSTALQLLIPDEMRGRIMSFSFTSMMALAPIGHFLGGVAAKNWTLPATLATLGVATAVVGVYQVVFPEPSIGGLGSAAKEGAAASGAFAASPKPTASGTAL